MGTSFERSDFWGSLSEQVLVMIGRWYSQQPLTIKRNNEQCHAKYFKINRCRQLALDDVADTNVDFTSNDVGSSLTYYPSVFFLLLFTT